MLKKIALILIITTTAASCTKVDVTFGNDGIEGDPNVSYFDTYAVDLATYSVDSFITSSHSAFTIGHHIDSSFGTITAGSYAEVSLPENPVKDKNVSFDSLEVLIKPNGDYYGDTLLPFTINVHRLLENIDNEDQANTNYYNSRRFRVNALAMGRETVMVRPKRGKAIAIRLSDDFGKDLLEKLKNNDDSISASTNFVRYFKGLYLAADTANSNAMYYFVADSTGIIMRLHYKLKGSIAQEKYLDFPFNPAKQFNQLSYNHTGTNLASFTPFKKQIKQSSVTGNKAYLHSNMGNYIKISFPDILSIKELHPYIKIIKALLVIRASPGSYRYPYYLPSLLNIYNTDEDNGLNSIAGNVSLVSDAPYAEKNQYVYDVTENIATIINEGKFSNAAFMVTPASGISDSKFERLIVNDQTLSNSIQLRLYVLGL